MVCLQFSVPFLPSLKVGEVHLTAMYATQILANMILVNVPISVVSWVFCNESATPRATLDWKPDELIMPFMQSLLSDAAQGGGGTNQIMIVEAMRLSVCMGGDMTPNVNWKNFYSKICDFHKRIRQWGKANLSRENTVSFWILELYWQSLNEHTVGHSCPSEVRGR